MKFKFDHDIFKEWFELNNMTRNRVIKALGQRDPNKASRWLGGQIIGTEDLIGLCNHYNLELTDFLIISNEDGPRIKTAIPDKMKEKREAIKNNNNTANIKPANESKTQTSSLNSEELALAKQSIMYEKRINELMTAHNLENKEKDAYTRQQLRERNEIVNTLQKTITTLNNEIALKQESEETLLDTIKELQQTIQQQQNTIASYDAIIRKQKKIPSQTSPFFSGQVTMVQDGGATIPATPPQNND